MSRMLRLYVAATVLAAAVVMAAGWPERFATDWATTWRGW